MSRVCLCSLLLTMSLVVCAAAAATPATTREAIAAFDRGDLDGAEQAFLRLLSGGDPGASTYYYLGLIAYRRDHSASAKRYWKKGLQRYPDDFYLRRVIGEGLLGAETARLSKEARIDVLRMRGTPGDKAGTEREMLWYAKGSPLGVAAPGKPRGAAEAEGKRRRIYSEEERRGCFVRSLVLPGWGQYSLGRKQRGLFFGMECGLFTLLASVLALHQRSVRRKYDYCNDPYEIEKLYHRGEELYRGASVFAGIAAGIWVWNLVDIVRLTAPRNERTLELGTGDSGNAAR